MSPAPPSWNFELIPGAFVCASFVQQIPSFVLNPFQSYSRFTLGGAGDMIIANIENRILTTVVRLCLFVQQIPSFVLNPFQSYSRFTLGDAGDMIIANIENKIRTTVIHLCSVCAENPFVCANLT